MSELAHPGTAGVRERILADHQALRVLLDRVGALAGKVVSDEAEAPEELRRLGLELGARFAQHLDFEDRWLGPALERSGAAGKEEAEGLRREHREQRLLLDYIVERLEDATRPKLVLGRDLQGFVQLVLEDMAHEERDLLSRIPADPGTLLPDEPSARGFAGVDT